MNTKQPEWRLGALSPSKAEGAKHYTLPSQNFPTPTRITNSLSTGTYTAKRDLSYRGMEVKHPSRGTGC